MDRRHSSLRRRPGIVRGSTVLPLLGLALAACGDGATAPPAAGTQALRFSVEMGFGGPYGPCRGAGEVPVKVTVTDQNGDPVPGLLVNLVATAGGGDFYLGYGVTSATGVVRDYWTLGRDANVLNVFEARGVDSETGAKVLYAADSLITQSRIAFRSFRDGNWEIYTMNADGSEVRRLTNNPASDLDPAWSPDGTRIAFASNRDGNYEIYVMNWDGTNLVRVTNHPAEDLFPAWQSGVIAFTSSRDGQYEIYTVAPTGANLGRQTQNGFHDVHPFGAYRASRPGGNFDIWSGITPLAAHPADDWEPASAPNLSRVAFSSLRDGNWEIYSMFASGTELQRLTNDPGEDRAPSYSPEASRIAFSTTRDGKAEIYSMNRDGSALQRLTMNEAHDNAPAWSGCTPFVP